MNSLSSPKAVAASPAVVVVVDSAVVASAEEGPSVERT